MQFLVFIKAKLFAQTGNRTRNPIPWPNMLSMIDLLVTIHEKQNDQMLSYQGLMVCRMCQGKSYYSPDRKLQNLNTASAILTFDKPAPCNIRYDKGTL